MHSLWTSLFLYWIHSLSTSPEAKGCSFLPREIMPFLLCLLRLRCEWLWHSQVTGHCASNLFILEDRIRSFSSLWCHCPGQAYDVYGVKQVNLSEFLKALWTVSPAISLMNSLSTPVSVLSSGHSACQNTLTGRSAERRGLMSAHSSA